MAKLKIKDERGKEWVHELIDDVTPVGRASSNTVQVVDGKASRQHFRIEKSGGYFKAVDLGSTNGTRLNSVRIQGEAFLKSGDVLSFGKTTFTYEGPSKPDDALSQGAIGGETVAIDPITLEEPKADGPKYVLKVIQGDQAGKTFELGIKPLTLGRHPANTLQVIDDAASNYHAEINREPIGYVVTDLGSTNGTRVKMKSKTDFEKVVKTPLSVGMQIRIGKTLLEFDNIGKPEENQELFGTVALDAAKLEEKLVEPRRKSKFPFALVAAVLVLAALVTGIVFVLKNPPPVVVAPREVPADTNNKIVNGDFSQGTDDEGNPRNFRVIRDVPGIKVAVVPEADRGGDKPDSKKMGLQISKTGAKSASTRTVVETSDTLTVQPGRAYEFAGWMKNNGDGLYGLRVTWLKGDSSLSEDSVVLKDTQEWKRQSAVISPPPWAERARLGVFVQGKDGSACFDDISFKEEASEKAAPPYPSVKFGGISVDFEGTKGSFSARLQNEMVLSNAALLLVTPDESAFCELGSAIKPQVKTDASKVSYDGRMYDFALQELTNYLIQAQPGASGVDLRVAMDRRTDAASMPRLRFFVVGPVAQGEVEINPGSESPERVAASNDKSLAAIQGMLFNVGKTPQFNLSFDKAVDVDLKRRGDRWEVVVKFKGDIGISLSPENMAQKQKMIAAISEVKKTLDAGNWGDAETKTAALLAGFASRFPEAKEEGEKAQQRINDQWKSVQQDITRSLNSLQAAVSPEGLKLANDTISRHMAVWTGSEKRVAELKDNLNRIESIKAASSNDKAEEEAERLYQKAQGHMNSKIYTIAIAILKTNILEDKVYSTTKVAKKAKDLLAQAEAAEQKKKELNSIQDGLREKSKNFLLAKDYKGAIEAIEKDKSYQDNKADLLEINDLLNEWRKKAQ